MLDHFVWINIFRKNQNVERFGDAFSINPDQLQPEVLEPILEN